MRNREGITLIELVISFAIIGIIAIVILGILDVGLVNIDKAGRRTETVLSVKEEIDSKILNEDAGVDTTITLTLPGDITKEVQGRIIEINEIDAKGNRVVIKTFTTN